jgi:hypothetical protein
VCGTQRDDPVIGRGLEWLRKRTDRADDQTSYESSALVLMLAALSNTEAPAPGRLRRSSSFLKPPGGSRFREDDWRWLHERVQHLVGCAYHTGGFGYGLPEPARADVSATQFAILALRAASFAGYPVEKARADVWARTAEFLREAQDPKGGFPYVRAHRPSRGMTAAAVSTLIICREQMELLREKVPPWIETAIAGGMGYLDTNLDVTSNPSPHFEGNDRYHYAHLYAIERAGMLSGRREFGGRGWYSRGAAYLLAEQEKTGRWADGTCMRPKDVLGTCFALLFLKRATIPAITR